MNPFSALSPELTDSRLEDDDDDDPDEVAKILGSHHGRAALGTTSPERKAGPVIFYTRERMLRIAKKCEARGWEAPPGLGRLDAWFGVFSSYKSVNAQQVEDPAIASIGLPSGAMNRRGGGAGFGEGFGFGGGIGGGRGIGKGARNIGLRRQPESQLDADGLPLPPDLRRDVLGGHMGRPSVKNHGEKSIKIAGDEAVKGRDVFDRRARRDDAEWRRSDKSSAPPSARNGELSRRPQNPWNNRFVVREEDSAEPAWMEDGPTIPSVSELDHPLVGQSSKSDSLIHFVPGEDMIAAHKRAMREREAGGDWRGEKPLVSFFGADPVTTPVGSGTPPGLSLPAAKAKVFNAADYLRPSRQQSDDDPEANESNPEPSAYQSRFQRFFNGPAPEPASTSGGQADSRWGRSEKTSEMLSPSIRSPVEASSPLQPIASKLFDRDSHVNSDDHMAKLMGLLTARHPASAAHSASAQNSRPSQSLSPFAGQFSADVHPPDLQRPERFEAHLHGEASYTQFQHPSPTRPERSSGHSPDGPSPSFGYTGQGHDPRSAVLYGAQSGPPHMVGPPVNQSNALLQQLYGPHSPSPEDHYRQPPSDALQLLAQSQRQQQMLPPPQGHFSTPPGAFGRGMPAGQRPPQETYRRHPHGEVGPLPQDFLNDLQSFPPQGFLPMGPRGMDDTQNVPHHTGPPLPGLQGFLPPHFAFTNTPRPPGPSRMPRGGPTFSTGPGHSHTSTPPSVGQPPTQAQQDMLATLFAGLNPRAGGGR